MGGEAGRMTCGNECLAGEVAAHGRGVCFAMLLAGLLMLTGCSGEDVEVSDSVRNGSSADRSVAQTELFPAEHTPSVGYVGSDACRRCHAEVSEAYAAHPMSRSLAAVLDADPVEDYSRTEFHTDDYTSYYVERTDEGVWHHERRVDSAGEVIYDQAVPVHIAVGSGIRGRSYLVNDEGRLKASPISWYSEIGEWGLSPGYPRRNHQRFDRQVSHGCLSCHAGRVEPHPTQVDRFAEQPILEAAIGCERCHGPGRDHIAFQESVTGDTDPADDPIINPVDFHDARRDATCNQCHLLGERRVVRVGRTEFDFRPGEYLSDNWTVFVKSFLDESNDSPAVSQVEQMHLSRCYQDSGGSLSCISCHDPHTTPAPAERVRFYRDRCLACHENGNSECSESLAVREQQAPGDSCIACHMPSFPATDVHAAQTDHRVLRRPDAEPHATEPAGPSAGDERLRIYAEPGVTVAPEVQDRARGIRMAELAYFSGADELAPDAVNLLLPILGVARQDVEGRLAVGQAFAALQRFELARQAWQQVLSLTPDHEKAIEFTAMTWMIQEQPGQARSALERLVDINPTRSFYFGRLAHVFGLTGNLQMSAAAAERALELNPSLFQTHEWLADVYRRLQNEAEAREHATMLQRFRTTLPPDDGALSDQSGGQPTR